MPSKSICVLCYAEIDRVSDGVSTSAACAHAYHVCCVKLRLQLQTSKEVSAAVRASCVICQAGSDQLAILKSINDRLGGLEESSAKVDALVREVQSLSTKVDRLAADYADVRQDFDELRGEVLVVKADVSVVARDAAANRVAIADLAAKVAGVSSGGLSSSQAALLLNLECRDMANHLIVAGVPECPGEDVKKAMLQLAVVLGVPLGADEIVKAERMGKDRRVADVPSSRAIILQISQVTKCDSLIAAKKALPILRASLIDGRYGDVLVRINRRWPAQLHQLRASVLDRFPALSPRAVWIANAAVWVRRDADSQPVKIFSTSDVGRLSA